jgi:hypothetical protein
MGKSIKLKIKSRSLVKQRRQSNINTSYSFSMKKFLLISLSVIFVAATVSACRSSAPHCQAYSKVNKVKADRTEKSI